MTTENKRYSITRPVGGQSYVVDTHTGKSVFEGSDSECMAYAEQHNAGHVQHFELLRNLVTSFVAFALDKHPLPWSIQSSDSVGAHVIADDGTIIIFLVDMNAAVQVVNLAKKLELERYHGGRPRN